MKPNKDAYGQEIWAHYNGRRAYEIVERDDKYIEVSGGPVDYFSEYKDWPGYYKKAIRQARGRVLDIGCGAGRHALYLQQKGFDVTGIDNSPLAIKACRLRGLKKAKILSITDVNTLKPNQFNTILMLGNNFGLFMGFNKARILLKKMHQLTVQDALIIAESRDPYKASTPSHRSYHRLNRRRGRLPGQVRMRIRFETYVGGWFDYLLVSKGEMKKIISGTGWQVKQFVDSGKASYIAIIEKINK